MKLAAAQSLVAWLWDQHPDLVRALAAQVPAPSPPKALGALGCCFSCALDIFTSSSCDGSDLFGSGFCFADSGGDAAGISFDGSDPAGLCLSSLDCSGLDSIGTIDPGFCIPTLTCADLTPVSTCAVTGCNSVNFNCSATTAGGLSGIASWVASGVAGLAALAKVATAYFNSQAQGSAAAAAQARAQAAIVAAQAARAAAGQNALPIQYVSNGNGGTTPVISTNGGLLPLTGGILAGLTPAALEVFFAQYGTWILIGGAAAFLAYAATRRRRAT